jgi:hypothetical protein
MCCHISFNHIWTKKSDYCIIAELTKLFIQKQYFNINLLKKSTLDKITNNTFLYDKSVLNAHLSYQVLTDF